MAGMLIAEFIAFQRSPAKSGVEGRSLFQGSELQNVGRSRDGEEKRR